MNIGQTAQHFLAHWIRSKRWDAFHSPYLYALFQYACDESVVFPLFSSIEDERIRLLADDRMIHRTDLGAGSIRIGKTEKQKIRAIARHALSRPFQCRFMARLVHFLEAKSILELGTSLGIATAYLAAGAREAKIFTIEGDPAIAEEATRVFRNLELPFSPIVSSFGKGINTPEILSESYDLIFLDGHHTSGATTRYFEALLPTFHEDTLIIVDDIHWSGDMYSGWKKLVHHPSVTQSVDCFYFGLLFFRKGFLNTMHHSTRLPWQALR